MTEYQDLIEFFDFSNTGFFDIKNKTDITNIIAVYLYNRFKPKEHYEFVLSAHEIADFMSKHDK